MKKVLKIMMFLVILVLGLQVCVYADMGAPMIRPYKAKVINPDGVRCRDHQGNVVAELKYGDEIRISYEATWEDEPYASFELDKETYTSAHIDLKDIAPVEEMYVSKELNVDEPIDRVVVAENGVELYKGPSNAYEKMGVVIPRGTEIVTYTEGDIGDNPWFYTTYEGNSGWVCELDALGKYVDKEQIYASEITLMELVTGDDKPKELATIPGNTVIKNAIILDPWSQSYYANYNGQWGRLSTREELFKLSEIKIYKTQSELKIYEEYINSYALENPSEYGIDKIPDVIGTIPANTEIAIQYEDYIGEVAYVSYNGVQGWVITPYIEDTKYVETTDLELPNFDNFTVIESPKIPVEEVKENTDNKDENMFNNKETVESEDPVLGDLAVYEDIVKGDKSNKEDVITIEVTPEQIIAFGVVGAIVIALTCIVTIVLINKTSKKNSEKEEVKVENKEDK